MTTIKKPMELIQEAKSGTFCLTAEGARALHDEDPSTLIIDVREPEEVAASAVPGALNIPRGLLEMKVEQVAPKHDAPVLLCCASGGRAALSAKALREMGYTNVKLIDCAHGDIKEAFQ
jgi:rhodanese-related sulfurtransferase